MAVIVLFDTDILIWAERGHEKAIQAISDAGERAISIFTYMELLQGARNERECAAIKEFLTEGAFQVLSLTENIGHRALIYVEEYARSSGMRAGDAVVAATAVENGFMLVSGNFKHFKAVQELKFKRWRA